MKFEGPMPDSLALWPFVNLLLLFLFISKRLKLRSTYDISISETVFPQSIHMCNVKLLGLVVQK